MDAKDRRIQVLRTIDKFDSIGRDGVVSLLQRPQEEFGAGLDPIEAGLVGLYLDTPFENMFLRRAATVRGRVELMAALEDNVGADGLTSWDRLLALPANDDETWSYGGRPRNIGWALDDLAAAIRRGTLRSEP